MARSDNGWYPSVARLKDARVEWRADLGSLARWLAGTFVALAAGQLLIAEVDVGGVVSFNIIVMLFAGALVNWLVNPTQRVLDQLDGTEYQVQDAEGSA